MLTQIPHIQHSGMPKTSWVKIHPHAEMLGGLKLEITQTIAQLHSVFTITILSVQILKAMQNDLEVLGLKLWTGGRF